MEETKRPTALEQGYLVLKNKVDGIADSTESAFMEFCKMNLAGDFGMDITATDKKAGVTSRCTLPNGSEVAVEYSITAPKKVVKS